MELESFFLRLGNDIRNHAVFSLVTLALFTVLTAFWAAGSRIDNSLSVWQNDDDPGWQQYLDFIDTYGVEDPLLVYLPGISPDRLDELADLLAGEEGIADLRASRVEPLNGSRAGLISILPPEGSGPAVRARIIRTVKARLDPAEEVYHLGGVWYLTDRLDNLSSRSTRTLFPVVIAILFTGVLITARRPGKVALIMACGLLPALQLTGVMAFAGVKLNMVLLALPPLTMILGMAHAIHLLTKSRQGQDRQSLLVFARVASPCLLSAATTMIGFLSLMVSDYQPVRELGFWGATGSLLSFATSLLLLPPFFKPAPGSGHSGRFRRWAAFVAKNKKAITFILLLSFPVTVGGMLRLERGSYILDFFTDDSVVRHDYEAIEEAGIGLTPLEVDLAGVAAGPEVLQDKLVAFSRQHPEITHFLYRFPSGIVVPVATVHGAPLPTPLTLDFMLEDVRRLTILSRTVASEKTLELVEDTEAFLQKEFGPRQRPFVTGSVPLYTMGQKQLFTTLITSFGTAFLTISLIMALALRSLRLGLLAIIANFLPVLLILGFMGWTLIPLSVATVTVASIVFGIVVDDTIHFLHSWKNRGEKAGTGEERLIATLAHVGPAMMTTTVVAGTAFLGFIVSPFIPLRNFGLLICLALWLALICDLLLLPALLLPGGNRTTRAEKPSPRSPS